MAGKRIVKRADFSDEVYVADAFRAFIEEKEANNLSEATLTSYEESYTKLYKFAMFDEETQTQELTQQLLYKWIGVMKLDGIKISSINHYLRDIRSFAYWCMDDARKYIEPKYKIKMLEEQEEIPKCFPDEDIALLLDKPGKRESFVNWRTWAIVNWVMGTGNRASTVCNVKIGDVDFKRKEIALRVAKNNKAQIIPLSGSLEAVLKEYIRIWRNGCQDEAYLFCNVSEDKLTTNALRQAFEEYCADRGVNQHNIHGLRHSFAKGWVKNNGNMFALQKILGHATLAMTRRYVKLFGEDLKDDFEKFNPLDSIKRKAKRTQTVTSNR